MSTPTTTAPDPVTATTGTPDALLGLKRLASPYGLVGRVRRLPTAPGDPDFEIYTSELGNLAQLHENVRESTGGRTTRGEFDGAGGGIDGERALCVSIAEALERYSSCTFDQDQLVWATANELGDEAIDLDTLPRHSERELADPQCPVVPMDKDAPMRWVRGVSLMTRREVWIPAVLVYLHIPARARGERFALPISTGCAAHSDLSSALLGALCEVVERDAIALTWLQRLQLPQIEVDVEDEALAAFAARDRHTSVTRLLFDGTTDLGIPTVYSLELSPHDDHLAQMVMASTTLDPQDGVVKVSREGASARIALSVPRPMPDTPEEFTNVFHGASWMGHRDRRGEFAFLQESTGRRKLSELPSIATGTPEGDLRAVLGRLEGAGMEAFAVDLTTDEADAVGFRVVRTVVPGLMPLSFARQAQYRGHPRLYEAPPRFGHEAHPESLLNASPQPFA
ncbi:YcaO-like family protein [Patulibacter minatonensis]|uniref:YcaO-like family protein n=1 Tax=Patulibacter minatonensis TaxID=298163 RepID=UPI00068742B2|nr:YcaO-like family protein [Patulibacter minatonensis]